MSKSLSTWCEATVFVIIVFMAMLSVVWFFSYQVAYAGYDQLRTYYDWGPQYGQQLLSPSSSLGRVLQATDVGTGEGQVISGYIEKFPNPNIPDANQYFIGVEKQGLVEIGPDQIPAGLDIDQLVGQYVALGTVNEEQILAPVPPPTDPVLVKGAVEAAEKEGLLPELPSSGTAKGFMHTMELWGEGLFDGVSNVVNPSGKIDRYYKRSIERIAEARRLLVDNDPVAEDAVKQVSKSMQRLFNEDIDNDRAYRLEESVAGIQTRIEGESTEVPEGAEKMFDSFREAIANGVDLAADELDRPPVTPGVVQGLASLKTIGVLQHEQADFIYGLESRQEVRDAFENFEKNGYITKADIKGALDEAAAAFYPSKVREIIELDKLEALGRFEAVRPDDATLARLKEFSATFVPGVTRVPPDLLPFWVASVNLDRIQQTIRPDYIPEEVLKMMERYRPNAFAKFKELEHRFKPSLDDVAALKQLKAQLREQFPDAEDIDKYLPPHMQRIAGFHDKFGLKDPEGWIRPEGVEELPFAGPGGLRDIREIEAYCASNDCSNYAPPSGFAMRPPVGVSFGPEEAQGPPIFPGMAIFKPSVVTYDIMPRRPVNYVGHGGCDNPVDCLKAFRDIPPEERAQNFFVFQASSLGANDDDIERPENYESMTSEERRAWVTEEIRSGRKTSVGFSPGDEYDGPLPGPGALYDSSGNYVPGEYRPGSYYDNGNNSYYNPGSSSGESNPYYPSYSKPINDYDSNGSWTPPPASDGNYYTPSSDDAPGGANYPPPDDSGHDGQAPPPDYSGGGDNGSQPEPGIPDGQAIPGPDDGGPSGDDPNSGGGDPPPSDDGGGGDPGGGGDGGGGEAPPGGQF